MQPLRFGIQYRGYRLTNTSIERRNACKMDAKFPALKAQKKPADGRWRSYLDDACHVACRCQQLIVPGFIGADVHQRRLQFVGRSLRQSPDETAEGSLRGLLARTQ